MLNLIFTVLITILSFYCGIKIEKQKWIDNSNENCLLKINNHFYKVIKDKTAKQYINLLNNDFISREELNKEIDNIISEKEKFNKNNKFIGRKWYE